MGKQKNQKVKKRICSVGIGKQSGEFGESLLKKKKKAMVGKISRKKALSLE